MKAQVEANTMSMDEKFFEKILRCELGDESVTNVTIKARTSVVGKGENFLSELSRITLTYSCLEKRGNTSESVERLIQKEISVVMKNEPIQAGPCSSLVKDQNLFKNEAKVVSKIMPQIEAILEKPISPKCIYVNENKNEPGCIILEDLRPLGFITKSRITGLPMAHVTAVLETIASLHASSVYLAEHDLAIMKSCDKGIVSEKTPRNMIRILEQTLHKVIDECKKWENRRYWTISEKLNKLEARFAQEMVEVVNYDEGEFCVLNHGDCWVNNIMFREAKNGNSSEVRLIDFQMSVYTSPVIDLIYFLSIAPSIDNRDKYDEFIEDYLQKLSKKMSILKCHTRPPTIEDLRRATLKRRMWAILAALILYPRMIVDSAESESFDELLESGETQMDIFKNPVATKVLQRSLLFMDERGYFD